jgi:pimeloyl-ACP methyl ester carboxylesterase
MIMIVVDGTGPMFNATYDQAMKNSFCSQIARALGSQASYYRGPHSFTVATVLRVWGGVANVIASRETRIFLAGYSRGGAAVTEVAHYLRDMALDVEAMFLFDPVKREGGLPNAGTIPRNVKNCYKILRTLSGSKGIVDSVLKWDSQVWDVDPYQRRWMGNTANILESSMTHLEQAVVNGSHGAAGGAPWYEHEPDRIATDTAAKWMTAMMQRHGLGVTLRSDWVAQNKVNAASRR